MKTWAVFALLCTTVDFSAGSRQQVNSCLQATSSYNERCFYIERRQMNWTQAQDNCQSMGGSLASIESVIEHQLIQEWIRNGTNVSPVAWVGGTAGEQMSIWRWIDGREITYSDWCPGEPNNPNQQCLQINYSRNVHFKRMFWGVKNASFVHDRKCWDNDFCEFLKASVCDVPAMYVSSATPHRSFHQLDWWLSFIAIFFSDML